VGAEFSGTRTNAIRSEQPKPFAKQNKTFSWMFQSLHKVHPNRKINSDKRILEISGYHGGNYEDGCLLGCYTVYSGRSLPTSIIKAITLMMEAGSTSETLVNFYQTTRCNISEDNHLQENISFQPQELTVPTLILMAQSIVPIAKQTGTVN
jgi:hypothetical protein